MNPAAKRIADFINGHKATLLIAVIALSALGIILFRGIGLTGQVAYGQTSTIEMNSYYTGAAEIPLPLQADITALRVSGNVSGTGAALIYLETSEGYFLVADSKMYMPKAGFLTGMAVSEMAEEPLPESGGDTIPDEQAALNRSGTAAEAIPDGETNESDSSADETDAGSAIAVQEGFSRDINFDEYCIDTCALAHSTGPYQLIVDVDPGTTLFISTITVDYEEEAELVQKRPLPDIDYEGSTRINLSEYFDGTGIQYSIDGLQNSAASISGDVLELTAIQNGSEEVKISASTDSERIESNIFTISAHLPSGGPKIDPRVRKALEKGNVRVILKLKDKQPSQAGKVVFVQKENAIDGAPEAPGDMLTGNVVGSENIFEQQDPGYPAPIMVEQDLGSVKSAVIDEADFLALSVFGDVSEIVLDEEVALLSDDAMGITRIADVKSLGYNGSGVRVCVLDTGFNYSLFNFTLNDTIHGHDFIGGTDDPMDDNGHGTAVIYPLLASAPDVSLYVAKVMDSEGVGYMSDVLAGLQYCEDVSASIISMSIGSGGYDGYCDDVVAQRVNELNDAGILVIAAAGNDGSRFVKSPACASGALPVSASTKQSGIAAFSSYNGATLLVAPGQDIVTMGLDGSQEVMSGTSMSVPFVAGAAALILQEGNIAPADMKDLLVHTGTIIDYSGRQFAQLDALNALNRNYTNNLTSGSMNTTNASNGTNGTFTTLTTVGPNDGSVFGNDASVGTLEWGNIDQALDSNDDYAMVKPLSASSTSYYLTATGFGFSIPSTATVDGILVEIEKSATDANGGRIVDNSVSIIQAGSIGGDEKADPSIWGTTDAYTSYGGAADLWGLTWTPNDINEISGAFGVAISARETDGQDEEAHVDHIRITVYYSPASVPNYSNFNGSTTNFALYNNAQLGNLSSVTLELLGKGKIVWNNFVNVKNANFDGNVIISTGSIYVNSSGLNATLNSSANLTMYNLSYTNPVPMRDGASCATCFRISLSGNNLTFNVTGFSNYTVVENTSLRIWDNNENNASLYHGNMTNYTDNPIEFFANYTNQSSGQVITGATCNLSISGAPSTYRMGYDSAVSLYNYSYTFTSQGTYAYNVTCNKTGFLTLTLSDTISIINPLNISFVQPTPQNNTVSTNTSYIFNVSVVNASRLSAFTWNWNGTNYTPYNGSLQLMFNFDNVSALGETPSSNSTRDISSYGRNGTCENMVGSVCNWNAGKYKSGISFDGINDYVNITGGGGLNGATQGTIMMWVKWTGTQDAGYSNVVYGPVLGRQKNGATSNNILGINSSDPAIGRLKWAPYNWNQGVAASTAVGDNVWRHVAVTFISGDQRMYLDGVLDGNFTQTGSMANDATIPLTIGAWIGDGAGYFNGTIDEVRVYNYVLSASEILQAYKSNLNKYASDSWLFVSNESNLTVGPYTYYAFVNDSVGGPNQTGIRTLNVTAPVTCGNLTSPNTLYTLTTNLSISGATCFNVTAQNVTLDCNGYNISGSNATDTYGVYSDQFNTTVKNCRISNFQHGIFWNSADNGTIDNNNIASTHENGFCIYLNNAANNNMITNSIVASDSNVGIYLYSSSDSNMILNSTSNSAVGIYFQLGSSFNSIVNSTFVASYGGGINIQSGINNSIIGSTGESYSGTGIVLQGGSGNYVTNSEGSSNSGAGIYLTSSPNNTIVNSTGSSNSSNGIYIYSSSNNSMRDSRILSNTSTVLRILASENWAIYNNTFISLNKSSTLVEIDYASGNNTFYWNNFTNTSGLYVNDTNGTNHYNSSSPGQNEGNIYANVFDGSIFVAGTAASLFGTNLFIGSSGASYPYNGSTSLGKFSCSFNGCADYAPIYPPLNCRVLSIPGTDYVLNTNVSIEGATCFNVTAQNVTLDCSSHAISGDNTLLASGVYSNQINTTVKNCVISGFTYGIFWDGADNGAMHSDNITTTFPSGLGIYLKNAADNNTITNSNSNSSTGHGIYVLSSSNNTIINSNFTSGSLIGILIESSLNNTIVNSTGTSNSNVGIYFSYSSNNMIVNSRNTIPSSSIGFYFVSSSNNTVVDSTGISGSNRGIFITGGSNNNLTNFTGVSNSSYGAHIEDSSSNVITNSNFTSNTNASIIISSGPDNMIGNSKMSSNTSFVLSVQNSNSSRIYNNTFISVNQSSTLVQIDYSSGNNTFYWNNFTNTSGLYVNDTNGTNKYNTTIGGQGAGNIWFNVINKSVYISGYSPSPFANLYYGTFGPQYPYNSTNSLGKVAGNVVDYAPLVTDMIPPTITFQGQTDANNSNVTRSWSFVNVSVSEAASTCSLNWSGAVSSMTASNSTSWYINKTGISDGSYSYFVRCNDTENNFNNSETRNIIIDTTNPVINLISPPNNTFTTDMNQTLSCNITDNFAIGNLTVYVWNSTGSNIASSVISPVYFTMCYQEWANVSTACGGLSTGGYFDNSSTGLWNLSHDGDWVTYANPGSTSTALFINYTKPSNAQSTSFIQTGCTDGLENWYYFNDSIPSSCWSQSPLRFKINKTSPGGLGVVRLSCQNSTGWVAIRACGILEPFVEEGMYWNLSTTTTVPLSGTSNSTSWIASFSYGDSYKWDCRGFDYLGHSAWSQQGNYTLTYSPIPSNVTLVHPTNLNYTVHERRPTFIWNTTNDTTYYEINITSNYCPNIYANTTFPTTNYTPSQELCLKTAGAGDTFYNWTVRACNAYICSNWSGTWNFSIEPWVVITFVNDTVNFGNTALNTTNDTTTNNPFPFLIQNDGNVASDLVNASALDSLWESPGAGLDTQFFQMKARNTSENNSFNSSASIMNWVNVSASNISLISALDYNDSKDSAFIDFRIEVPPSESSGNKHADMILSWKQSP